MRCIHNGIIHTAVDPQPFTGDILMDGGKIVAIGPDLKRDDAEIIDASGLNVILAWMFMQLVLLVRISMKREIHLRHSFRRLTVLIRLIGI